MKRQKNGTQDGLDKIGIDTEWFKHEGRLHRPGGSFACLSHTEGLKRDRCISGVSDTRDYLETLKTRPNLLIAMQNAEYDIRQLRNLGFTLTGSTARVWDTMLVEQALFGGWYQLNSLADLSRRWLGRSLDKDIRSQFLTQTTLTRSMREYAISDAQTTLDVATAQYQYVVQNLGSDFSWYWNIDLPAMWAILDMKPVRIDVDAWMRHAQDLHNEGIDIQEELGFNVKSPDQVKKALRTVGIKAYKSVDVDAMAMFLEKAQHSGNEKQIKMITGIMRARKCRDAMSKYGARWIEENVEDGEWVYPSWNVTGASTGRMSSSKPNMQNIPKRGEEGAIYRTFFKASKGHRLLIGDVQQQEPRFSAHLSKDPVLQKEILDGVDLHKRAAKLFGLSGRGARDRGKAINLGLNYGMSAYGLAARVGISIDEAEDGLRARRRHYSRYYSWQERQRKSAKRYNYVRTVTGRPVWVNPYSFKYTRNAINGPIQGSAADHTKLALAYVHEQCASQGIPFVVNLVVHDEIVLDVPPGMMKTYRKILDDSWKEAGHKLMPSLPTVVDMVSGMDWGAEND